MNLNDTIRLRAGGPGSGRHKTTDVAEKHGYKSTDQISYSKGKNHKLTISPEGRWKHEQLFPKGGGRHTIGTGPSTLDTHLTKVHG